MAKASGSIDLKSLKVAGEPNKYITKINENGITVHAANNVSLNYVQIDSDGLEIFKSDGANTPSAISIAKFGSTVRVGEQSNTHITLLPTQINIMGTDGAQIAYFGSNSRFGRATDSYVDVTPSGVELVRSTDGTLANRVSLASFGESVRVGPVNSGHTIINGNGMEVFNGSTSLASFGSTVRVGANVDGQSRVEISSNGIEFKYRVDSSTPWNLANIEFRNAFGNHTIAKSPTFTFGVRGSGSYGQYSFVVGSSNMASELLTTAFGLGTSATETGAFAEGWGTTASGKYSHAEGYMTTAGSDYQHVMGKCNANNSNNAFEIGNGTVSTPANILTVDWSGDLKISGYAYINNYLDIKTPKSSSAGGWARGIQFMDASDQPYAYIQSYGGGDTASYLYIGYGAYNGSNLRVLPDGHIQVVSNGLTLSLGAQNTSGIHVYSSDTSKPIFLNTSLQLVSNNDIGSTTYGCGDIYLANTKGLKGKSSGGQDWSLVWTNTSNQCGYGYGSYTNSSGTVFYDGNAVYIRSKTNIQIQASSGIFTNHDIVVPNAKSYRSQNSSGTVVTMLYMSSGNVITLGNSSYGTQLYGSTVKSTPMVTSSDIRKKTNINQLGKSTDDVLLGLDTFDFNFKDGEEESDGRLHYGISAQQLKTLLEKEDIDTSKTHIVQEFEDYLQVSYTELIPMLIHLCQSQQREIDKLKEKTQSLEERLTQLELKLL